jgi:large subunit ribosomal protein L3
MMLGLMARKVGMTQIRTEDGNMIPVTVVSVEPNLVVSKRVEEEDGYSALVLGVGDFRNDKAGKPRVSKLYAGQFAEGITPKRKIREFRDFEKDVNVGDSVGVELFEDVRYVDVTAVSKGKGFQGVVKRWGFGGGRATHGSKFHREPGSTGQSTYPHKTFKNVKLPGRMGREQVTTLSQRLVRVDTEHKLLLIQGSVPGVNKGLVVVRKAVKKR